MCNPILLHNNSNGYISRCIDCGQLRIAFGTSLLVLQEQEFDSFVGLIIERMQAHQDISCRNRKQFHFYTDSRQVQLIFSFAELENLYHLLVPAQLMLQLAHL